MSDAKKQVDLEFTHSGDAAAKLKEMRADAQALERLRQAHNREGWRGGPAAAPGAAPVVPVADQTRAASTVAQFHAQQPQLGGLETVLNKLRMEMTQLRGTAREQLEYTKMPTAEYAGGSSRGERGNGAGGMSGALKLGVVLGAAHVAAAAMTHGLQQATHALDTFSNSNLLASQKAEGLAGSIPLVGGVLTSLIEFSKSVNLVTETIRQRVITSRDEIAHAGDVGTAARQTDALLAERQAAQNRATAFQGMTPFQMGPTARTTLAEQISYGEAQRTKPHDEAIRRSEAEVGAAKATLGQGSDTRAALEKELANLEKKRTPVTGKITDTGIRPGDVPYETPEGLPPGGGIGKLSDFKGFMDRNAEDIKELFRYSPLGATRQMKPEASDKNRDFGDRIRATLYAPERIFRREYGNPLGLGSDPNIGKTPSGEYRNKIAAGEVHTEQTAALDKAGKQLREMAEIEQTRQRLQEAINREKGQESDLATKQNQLAQERVAREKEVLEVLKQREQLAATGAQRLGMMSRMERKRATDSLEQLEKIGIANAPEWMKQRAERIAPMTVHNLAEQYGQKSPEFARLQKLTPEYRDRLPDIRKQVDEQQKKVGHQEQVNVAGNAQSMAEAVGHAFDRLVVEFNKRIQLEADKRIAAMRFGAAAGGAGK